MLFITIGFAFSGLVSVRGEGKIINQYTCMKSNIFHSHTVDIWPSTVDLGRTT